MLRKVPTFVLALSTLVASLVVTAAPAEALDNGLALTPPMGFNNWNTTGCNPEFNEQMVLGTADMFLSKGLKTAGYSYVNIDDCWAEPQRDGSGNLVPNHVRFPHGIKYVADYVHSKGLKFGLYTSAGTKTCDNQGFPGGLGHERDDANLFASWGVDYLKYDNCNNQGVDVVQRYTAMRDALAATGRKIVFSICEWGSTSPWNWAQGIGNSWRTTGDISDNWASMMSNFHQNLPRSPYAKPGAWNDPDMLEVGNGGMTPEEYRTHFSLWAMMSAPLLIGAKLNQVSAENLGTLVNQDVIRLDQDTRGVPARQVGGSGGAYVLARPLANGDGAVALFNQTASALTISTTTTEAGIGGATSYQLKDLWSKAVTTTTGAISASVPAHATVVFRVSHKGTLAVPPSGASAVSDFATESWSNGWGPIEKDRSNGEAGLGDGRGITIGGTAYAKGIGTHARSDISYYLAKQCSRFTADVGLDGEVGGKGSVGFEVYADDTKIADTGTLTGSTVRRIDVPLSGVQRLRLVVSNGGDGIDYNHADWANPVFTCA